MLCFRCGSPVTDGADSCDNCGQDLSSSSSSETEKFADIQKKLRQSGLEWKRDTAAAYRIGEVVAERYEIAAVLGQGPLGTVYRAFDQEVEVDVALKVINGEYLPDDGARNHFLLSLQNTRDLVHDNVVRYFDIDKDGDRCFYVMQYLDGLTLRKIIDLRRGKGQRFSIDEVVPIYSQLCRALGETCKVMGHGGVKPANIFILPDLVKITDFGLPTALPLPAYLAAQRSGGEDYSAYLAPEIRNKDPHDVRADVYSVGVILTELLSGKPYDGGPVSIHEILPEIPDAVDAVLRRALASDPADRFADAGELGHELSAALEGAEVGATIPAEVLERADGTGESIENEVVRQESTNRLRADELLEVEDDDDDSVEQDTGRLIVPPPERGGAADSGAIEVMLGQAGPEAQIDYSDPAVPPPAKEPSQITQQLDEEDLEFQSQTGEVPVDGPAPESDDEEEDILSGPPPDDDGEKTTRVSQEEMEQKVAEDDEEPLLPEEVILPPPEPEDDEEEEDLGPPPPDRTQQIDEDMIMEGGLEDDEDDQEQVLLVPPGDLNHSELSGETDDESSLPVPEPAQEPSFRPLADGLSEKATSKESVDREARAREALQAFDFDATLQEAVEQASHIPEPEEETSGQVPLPRGEVAEQLAVTTEAAPSAGAVEAPAAVALSEDLADQLEDDPEVGMDVTQAVSRPKRSKKALIIPLVIIGFILLLVGGTGGFLYYWLQRQAAEQLMELELKKALALKGNGGETPGKPTQAPAVVPKAIPRALPPDAAPAAAPDAAPKPRTEPKPAPRTVVKREPRVKRQPTAAVKREPRVKRAPRVLPKPLKPEPKGSSAGKCLSTSMRFIPGRGGAEGYCIDRYEYPGRGRKPARASLGKAKSTCRARGQRLCLAKEWIRACGGLFPYGRKYDDTRCNTGGAGLVASGSKRRCRSRWGLYDMSGNVSEWVAEGSAMGGDVKAIEGHAGCMSRGGGGGTTGFRCCADPELD